MNSTFDVIVTGITVIASTGITSGLISILTLRRTKRIEESVKRESQEIQENKKILNELVGPVVMGMHVTKRAFKRYSVGGGYLENFVLKEANKKNRDLLMDMGHMLQGDMLMHALCLIEHYDAWLGEWDRMRAIDDTKGLVWAGPAGYPFPKLSEEAFMEFYKINSL